jgi:hypothetical protein
MKIRNGSEMDSITGGKSIKKKIGALKKTVPFLVVILLVTTALCYGGPQSDCPPCIVGYWKIDESSGAIVPDSYGGNHGEVVADGDGNDPVWMTGIVGNALHFAGDADDKVVIGDDDAYHFGTGDFALEAWIKYKGPTDGTVRYPAIMSKRPPGLDPSEGFGLYLSYLPGGTAGSLLLLIEDTNYYQSSTPLDDGEWHYVVVQRCQDQVQIYVDGLLDATVTSTKDATTNADLTLGLDESSQFDTEWEGLIDEVAVYNCCLSPETINYHYECRLNGEGYCFCECGEWEDVTVTWTSPSGTQESWTGHCGETSGPVILLLGTPIEINTSITCGPSPPCLEPNYEWEVTKVGPGPPFSASGVTLPVSFIPTATGWNTFEVNLSASCGNSPCSSCTIRMKVNPSEPCIDIEKKVLYPTTGEFVDSIEVPVGTEVGFVITVCNCGTYALENISVVDYFPDCLEYLDSGASVTIDGINISGNQVIWYFGSSTLQPGDCFDMKVKAMVVSEGDCENCVKLQEKSRGGIISDKDCATFTVTGEKTADAAPEGSEESGGQCLGSALLIGILALGAIALNRKKE